MNQKRFNVEKQTKIKIKNDFIINKETLNAKTFKKNNDNIQLIYIVAS